MTPTVAAGLAGGGLLVIALAGCGPSTEAPRAPPTPSVTSTPSTPTATVRSTATVTRTARPTETVTVTTSPSAPVTTQPACGVPTRLRGQDLEGLPVDEKVVALTFDAGANAAGVASILETLETRRATATFFLTGQFVRTFPGRAARIASRYLVGNHTDSHADLTTLPYDGVVSQVRRAQSTILGVTGQDPRRFFRFPYGARTAREIEMVNELCYVPFRWTVDTLGWQGTSSGRSVESIVSRVMAAAAPGAIVLMHVGAHPEDGSTLDADALPIAIRELRRAGYRLVPLSYVLPSPP